MEKKDKTPSGSWGITITELEERLRSTLPNHGGTPIPEERVRELQEGKITVTIRPNKTNKPGK